MIRPPCKTCPWRLDARADRIPNFNIEKAEGLIDCNRGELGDPSMACHQSRDGEEFYCAGWLAQEGYNNLTVRIAVIVHEIPVEALSPGDDWPELHTNYNDVLDKLRRTM